MVERQLFKQRQAKTRRNRAAAYERDAEEMAVRRLLNGRHFKRAIAIGKGYGQLSVLLEEYAKEIRSVDSESNPGHSSLPLKDASADLVTIVQMMHLIEDPVPLFTELSRVLTVDGLAVIEVANYTHGRNRLKHIIRRKKLPAEAVTFSGKNDPGMMYVNHNPDTVRRQLAHAGLKVERILSVSNLRSPALAKIMPRRILLAIEGILQPTLANSYFGPSVYFLVGRG